MEHATESAPAGTSPEAQASAEKAAHPEPASAPRSRPSQSPAPRAGTGRALALTAIVLVFFGAVVAGRAFEPALLGWRAGLERTIDWVDRGSALLGQLAVAGGCLLAIQLLIATLVENRLSVLYRLAIAPLSAALITLTMASATRELPLLLVIVLALLTGLMALIASLPTVLAAHTRAAGFVLGLAGITALLQILARLVAVWASHEVLTSVFRSAQVIATIVFVLHVALLFVAGAWLSGRHFRATTVVTAGLVAVSLFLALLAVHGAGSPGGWKVLANRAFAALARNPRPLLPDVVQYTLQALTLLMVPVTLLVRRDRPVTRSAIALVLLASGGTDLPVHALALGLATLAAPIAAARERHDENERS
jgi:hypothetical protein